MWCCILRYVPYSILFLITWWWYLLCFLSVLDNIYIAAIVTRLWLSNLGFRSRQGHEIFLFSKMSSLVTGPRQPPIQWVLVFLLGVTYLGCQVYHSPPSKVMNLCRWTSTPSLPICLHGVDWDSVLPLLDCLLIECPTRFASPLFLDMFFVLNASTWIYN